MGHGFKFANFNNPRGHGSLSTIAMEHGPFSSMIHDDEPIQTGDFP